MLVKKIPNFLTWRRGSIFAENDFVLVLLIDCFGAKTAHAITSRYNLC